VNSVVKLPLLGLTQDRFLLSLIAEKDFMPGGTIADNAISE